MKTFLEDLISISKGKASIRKIGSRKVPHRLRQNEKIKFELALKKGFLDIDFKTRDNVINLYEKYCYDKKIEMIVLYKDLEGKYRLQVYKISSYLDKKTIKYTKKLIEETIFESKNEALILIKN